jgi:hypothetical protein
MNFEQNLKELICDNVPRHIHLTYDGPINNQNVNGVLEIAQSCAQHWGKGINTSKLLRLLVEVLQNIVKHGQNEPAWIVIYTFENKLFIQCSNIITQEDKGKLNELFEIIKQHPANDLQQLYREQLKQSKFNTRGGAGIGVFDMAYRTGSLPKYEFEDLEVAGLVRYTLTVSIDT